MNRQYFESIKFALYNDYKKRLETLAKMWGKTPRQLGMLDFEQWEINEKRNLKIEG